MIADRSKSNLTFELARPEHTKAIQRMRQESGFDLTERLGSGGWSGSIRLPSIKERISSADPENLRRSTLYVACRDGEAMGSVVVSTYPPAFWKRSYWREPRAAGLGVFNLVVFPEQQKQGIGRFLMEGVEELARDHGIPFVRLDAFVINPFSTAFYRRLDYDERAVIDVRTCGLILFEKRVI